MAKPVKLSELGDKLNVLFKGKVDDNIDVFDLAVRKAVIKTWGKIIKLTPVGNPTLWKSPAPKGYVGGRARANWFVDTKVDDKITSIPRNKGPAYVASSLPRQIVGQKVFMYNNLPYIRRLEYGHSTQAPAGMVRKSMAGFGDELQKQFKTELKKKGLI